MQKRKKLESKRLYFTTAGLRMIINISCRTLLITTCHTRISSIRNSFLSSRKCLIFINFQIEVIKRQKVRKSFLSELTLVCQYYFKSDKIVDRNYFLIFVIPGHLYIYIKKVVLNTNSTCSNVKLILQLIRILFREEKNCRRRKNNQK